jgi:hypothetical protein
MLVKVKLYPKNNGFFFFNLNSTYFKEKSVKNDFGCKFNLNFTHKIFKELKKIIID